LRTSAAASEKYARGSAIFETRAAPNRSILLRLESALVNVSDDSRAGRRYIRRRPAPSGLLALSGVEGEMTGSTRSSDGLDVRRRRLLFRSWHRGMREMDLIMGRFADHAVADMADGELTEFERLIDVPDRDLLAWITGEADVPAAFDTIMFRRLRQFHMRNGGL
jgi:antitoxin CptB